MATSTLDPVNLVYIDERKETKKKRKKTFNDVVLPNTIRMLSGNIGMCRPYNQ